MADFKLLGGTDPPDQQLGLITQAIGSDLLPIDGTVIAGPVTVRTEEVLRAASFVDQPPAAVDTPLQVSFGAPQATANFSVDAAGTVTCLIADEYAFWLRVQFGRTGNPGTAITVLRALLNGTPVGATVYTELDTGDDRIPGTFQGILDLAVNDVITVEIIRDSAGSNAGGIYTFAPTLAGWAPSPSAQLIANRTVAVT